MDIGVYHVPADSELVARIVNVGGYTSGQVLRADAMKFTMIDIVPLSVYVADNDSSAVYQEFGPWHTSVTQSFGSSSRYSWLTDSPGTRARFTFQVWEAGTYSLEYILPQTENSTDKAVYIIAQSGEVLDSVRRNQNTGSGAWVSLGDFGLRGFKSVTVDVINDPGSQTGLVLRADAVRAVLIPTGVEHGVDIPLEYALDYPFPNPFNPSTTIRFHLPKQSDVSVTIHDLLGRLVAAPVDERLSAGSHAVQWHGAAADGRVLPTGMYLVRFEAGGRAFVRKVVLLK